MSNKPVYISIDGKPALERSLQKFNLEYEFAPTGTSDKPAFIWEMMQKYKPSPVVYLDREAVVASEPIFFDEPLECPVAAHFYRGGQLQENVLYFNNSEQSESVVKKWQELGNLQQAIDLGWDNVCPLTSAYCYMGDTSKRTYIDSHPVIQFPMLQSTLNPINEPAKMVPAYLRTANQSFEAREHEKRNGRPYSIGHQRMYTAPIELLKGKADLDILEVGAGIGFGLKSMLDAGIVKRYTGVEPDTDSYKLASKARGTNANVEIFNTDFLSYLKTLNFTPRYDYVFCIEVIEHVPQNQIAAFLQALKSVTKRNLFLSTPNALTSPHGTASAAEWARVLREAGFHVAAIERQWTTLFVCEA